MTGGNVSLIGGESGTNNWASIYSNGAQNLSAPGLTLTGGTGGTFNWAAIGSSGDQHISTRTSTGITIEGGGGTSYGNYASIGHGGNGNQTININGGGSITLVGGSGTGATSNNPNLVVPVCASDPNCFSVPVADDAAGISSSVGNQSIAFQTAGGVLSLSAGSGGNENKVYVVNSGTGTESITGFPTITLTGGASGGSNYLSTNSIHYLLNNASLFSPNGPQMIQANSLTLNGMAAVAAPATQTDVAVYGKGQNITVTDAITLNSGTSAVAYTSIYSLGNQSITAGSIALNAGAGGTNNYAQILGYGDQQISTSGPAGITLQGGTGASYANYATINHGSGGSGNQTININGGGSVTLVGGSGTGTTTNNGNLVSAVCVADPNCFDQPITGDFAIFNNHAGNEVLNFQGTGGTLSLTGGSGGSKNNAAVSNQNINGGTQTITGYPTIILTGGSSGGNNYQTSDGIRYLLNSATLFSPYGGQTIEANSLTLNGASPGAVATAIASASVYGLSQNIAVTNAIALNSGASSFADTLIESLNGQAISAGSLSLAAGSGSGNGAFVLANFTPSVTMARRLLTLAVVASR